MAKRWQQERHRSRRTTMILSNRRTTLLQQRAEETGEVDTILGGSNSWGNDSAPPSAQHTLGIPGGDGLAMTQQAMTFTA